MNAIDYNILLSLYKNPYETQKILSESTGYALGTVNKSVRKLTEDGYLTEEKELTKSAHELISSATPRRAVILAAGFGMRMVPINTELPKGLLEIDGEPLVERQIRQLHEVGVTDISVVVGFLKEKYEYLIDKYQIKLIINTQYAKKNNLHSLALAGKSLQNTYIVPCDIWCEHNPFHENELYSWYMVTDSMSEESTVRVNRKNELMRTDNGGNMMIGIAYLCNADAGQIADRLCLLDEDRHYDNCFWEEALYSPYKNDRMTIDARVVGAADAIEINTYEQLRELDHKSNQLQSDAIRTISEVLSCRSEEITKITVLKKGMTNRSFMFECRGQKYIMRIPGEGTDRLINREDEANVYARIKGHAICDDLVYINPKNGYKITKYIQDVRNCNVHEESDLIRCMEKLRSFHNLKLQVEHTFDLFERIEFYEHLWGEEPSIYRDYKTTKQHICELKPYIEQYACPFALTHIDAVPDNFLFYRDGSGDEKVQLTDWEYSAMQDQDVDIAMFCIYSLYGRQEVDHLIDLYFEGDCPGDRRIKIYCYIAVSGLLWSNWCEYKRNLGVEFGEYSIAQYRYAKEYYRIVMQELNCSK